MAKLVVNAALGIIEVDGDEKFVSQIYADLKDLIRSRISNAKAPPPAAAPLAAQVGQKDEAEKKKRTTPKKTGPSCSNRIAELKTENFFTNLRDAKSISDALAERGHHYESKHIAAALIAMTKRGELRRVKNDGAWAYQNP
jgi:hypothetical protein